MFVPVYDGKPVTYISLQWVTLIIIAINVLIFLVNLPFAPTDGSAGALAIGFGHVPSVSYDTRVLPEAYRFVPDSYYFLTAITYAFVHSDIWHVGGNMLFLWVFGDNVEDAMGHIKFLIFYLAAAFASAWFHALVFPASDSPLIGASGAAAAVVTAYLMLHPKMKVWVLFLGRIPLRLPALWLIGAWIAFQVYMFLFDDENTVSWAAHLGGIMFGIVLTGLFKRRAVPLFDREIVLPEAAHTEKRPGRWGRD